MPHVAFPTNLPPNLCQRRTLTDEVKSIPIDPKDWDIITDAMGRVLLPEGTAGSAHLQGIDFAGKTGSAQTISNALQAPNLPTARQISKKWLVCRSHAADAILTLLCARCSKVESTASWPRESPPK